MAKPRHLARAPIVEAVIDFRARTAAGLRMEELSELGPELRTSYPHNGDPIALLEWAIRGGPGKGPVSKETDHGKIGFRFTSADGRHVLQLRKDGFTLSRLAPYPDWTAFLGEAARTFDRFCAIGQIEAIHRIAIRYINRMPLPAEQVGDFSAFLTAPPPFPKEVPAFMNHFLTQVQVQEAGSLAQATVTQTIQQGQQSPGLVPVILDIDVFQSGNFPIVPPVLLGQLAPLRDFKNRLFFASITEKTADLFA